VAEAVAKVDLGSFISPTFANTGFATARKLLAGTTDDWPSCWMDEPAPALVVFFTDGSTLWERKLDSELELPFWRTGFGGDPIPRMVFASGPRAFLQLESLSQMAESVAMKFPYCLFTRSFPPRCVDSSCVAWLGLLLACLFVRVSLPIPLALGHTRFTCVVDPCYEIVDLPTYVANKHANMPLHSAQAPG
jgi:hypothetical protein